MPGLSERSQKLVMRTLQKVEKEKLKAFLGGMFIEPGTVLRGDESEQPEPLWVIFSCVPYFDLRKPSRTTPSQSDRLHPPRTLVQSYYPYEPVQERDAEQAYRKFGNDRTNSLIHVPSLWMMNIGSSTVVTCGYRTLASELVKSIEVVQEDPKQLNMDVDGNTSTSIRLTDQNGRVLLYSLDECKTFFELEQRLRELGCVTAFPGYEQSLPLAWNSPYGDKKVTARNWLEITLQRGLLFVNLAVIDENKAKELDDEIPAGRPQHIRATTLSKDSVPPFFQWPVKSKTIPFPKDPVAADDSQCIHCLDLVEKAILSETLPDYDTTGMVDRSFTSTEYYEALQEDTIDHVNALFASLEQTQATLGEGPSQRTYHQAVIEGQCSQFTEKAGNFVSVVHKTFKLFLSDVDQSTILRKVWGAMANIASIIRTIQQRDIYKPDPEEYKNDRWRTPIRKGRTWYIRAHYPRSLVVDPPLPKSNDAFAEFVKNCTRCQSPKPFLDPNDALAHLRSHHQHSGKAESLDPNTRSYVDDVNLKDWIRNEDEYLLETSNAGCLALLNEALAASGSVLRELTELVDGVKKQDGNLSELYTLPRQLLETFRRIVLLYLAVERSLHFIRGLISDTHRRHEHGDPSLREGLQALERFSESIMTPLRQARATLCEMVRSPSPNYPWKRMSLGPEYICSWLMRRLLVRPLGDQSMTVADIYREYLSTLVSHISIQYLGNIY